MEVRHEHVKRYALPLWQGEGTSSRRVAQKLGVAYGSIGNIVEHLGFFTASATEGGSMKQYTRGPCLECWKVRPRRQIIPEEGYRCTTCVGYARVRERIPVDVAAEREASLARTSADPSKLQGIQKRKPYWRRGG